MGYILIALMLIAIMYISIMYPGWIIDSNLPSWVKYWLLK